MGPDLIENETRLNHRLLFYIGIAYMSNNTLHIDNIGLFRLFSRLNKGDVWEE